MDKRIQKAHDHLRKNYKERVLLADLAARFKLSAFHFQRLFKKEMNETPSECLNRIRLERALHLIRAVDEFSMTRISRECGFSSPATFSRAFAKKFKTSPTEYAKKPGLQINLPVEFVKKGFEVEIVHFPGVRIFYSITSIYQADLLNAFEAAASYCELEGIPYLGTPRYGVFTHTVFHGPQDTFNYYAGVPLKASGKEAPGDRVFSIPKGKYATFITDSPYQFFRDILMYFKTEWMDKMNYSIADLFGFEEVLPGNKKDDYPRFRRKVYIPIRSKS